VRASLAVFLLVAACGGSQHPVEPEEQETERGQIPDDVVGPPNVAWKDLDRSQRKRFMERVVVPTMRPLFAGFDGKRFADFGCKTCHGRGHDFKMPNPELFALTPTVETDKPAFFKFMTSEVKPEMAKLLGLSETDFACTTCHPRT